MEVAAEETDPHERRLLGYGRFRSLDDAGGLILALHMRSVGIVSCNMSR